MYGWVAALITSVLLSAPPMGAESQAPKAPDEHVTYWMTTARQHPHAVIRKNAVRMLGNLHVPEAVPVLMEALKDENYQVRYEAAVALGRQGDERAFGALRDLADRESDQSVRKAAKQSIELINAHLEYQKKNEDAESSPQGE